MEIYGESFSEKEKKKNIESYYSSGILDSTYYKFFYKTIKNNIATEYNKFIEDTKPSLEKLNTLIEKSKDGSWDDAINMIPKKHRKLKEALRSFIPTKHPHKTKGMLFTVGLSSALIAGGIDINNTNFEAILSDLSEAETNSLRDYLSNDVNWGELSSGIIYLNVSLRYWLGKQIKTPEEVRKSPSFFLMKQLVKLRNQGKKIRGKPTKPIEEEIEDLVQYMTNNHKFAFDSANLASVSKTVEAAFLGFASGNVPAALMRLLSAGASVYVNWLEKLNQDKFDKKKRALEEDLL